jgi:hypothetical protein
MVTTILASPIFFALGVPGLFLLAGALARKVVRGSGGWEASDFFFGIEATLAAMSAGFVNIFDLVRGPVATKQPLDGLKLAATSGFLVVTFILLMVLLSIHQDWDKNQTNPKQRKIWLGLVSNGIGLLLMGGFILMIKGIQ